MTALEVVLGAVAAWLVWRLIIWSERSRAYAMLAEFEHKWPDRCPLCCFDRHAAREGVHLKPIPHDCPERQPQHEAVPAARAGNEVSSV